MGRRASGAGVEGAQEFGRLAAAAIVACFSGISATSDTAAGPIGGPPPPPVQMLPLEQIEPPHTVPATVWKPPPYCLVWRDRCTECRRPSVHATATCSNRTTDPGECAKSFSFCSVEDQKFADKTCRGLGFLGFRWAEFDGSSEAADVFIRRHIEGSWWSNWQLVRGKWTRYDEDDLNTPERPAKELLAIPAISGVVCLAAYAPSDFQTTSKTKN
jgi:hypothetical protein